MARDHQAFLSCASDFAASVERPRFIRLFVTNWCHVSFGLSVGCLYSLAESSLASCTGVVSVSLTNGP